MQIDNWNQFKQTSIASTSDSSSTLMLSSVSYIAHLSADSKAVEKTARVAAHVISNMGVALLKRWIF